MDCLPKLDYTMSNKAQSNLFCMQIFLTTKPINYTIRIAALSMKPFYQFFSKNGSDKHLQPGSEAPTSRDTDLEESPIPKVK